MIEQMLLPEMHGVLIPQTPVAELPLKTWKVAWTKDTHLTSELHGEGGIGVTTDRYDACTREEAREMFDRDWAFARKPPFILVIKEETNGR